MSDLERLGLVVAFVSEDGATVYDHEALVVTTAAASLAAKGMEPRHLRMFKVAAEREAGVFEQVTSHLAHRDGSRGKARDELNELARLGETIHRSVLRRALGDRLH